MWKLNTSRNNVILQFQVIYKQPQLRKITIISLVFYNICVTLNSPYLMPCQTKEVSSITHLLQMRKWKLRGQVTWQKSHNGKRRTCPRAQVTSSLIPIMPSISEWCPLCLEHDFWGARNMKMRLKSSLCQHYFQKVGHGIPRFPDFTLDWPLWCGSGPAASYGYTAGCPRTGCSASSVLGQEQALGHMYRAPRHGPGSSSLGVKFTRFWNHLAIFFCSVYLSIYLPTYLLLFLWLNSISWNICATCFNTFICL